MVRTRWLCIDFTKTRGWQPRDPPVDRLATCDSLLAWCRQAGVLTGRTTAVLRAATSRDPASARRILRNAVHARAVIYGVLTAVGTGRRPKSADMHALNALLRRAARHRLIGRGRRGYDWTWRAGGDVEQLLWPIVFSAAELLTAPELGRLRLCDADDCGWLFIDGSRNGTRRWCDMSDCGNRAKLRRYRARHRRPASALMRPASRRSSSPP